MRAWRSKTSRLGQSAAAATDDDRLDLAMQRGDDLLVRSLQSEERQRTRRRKQLFFLGGFAMLATLCIVLVSITLWASGPAPAAADESAKLTQQGWQIWQQDPEAARDKFAAAVKLAPKNTNAWNGLGWCNFNTGRRKEAAEAFKKVIVLEPKHPAALNGLGQIALFDRNYEEAKKYLLKAAPQASAAWYGLAKIYLLEGKWDAAKKWSKKIVDSGEADESARQMLAAAEARELPDELRKLIEPAEAIASSPEEFAQAWRYFNQGRNAEARELFEKLLAEKPGDPNIENGLGWALLNSGEAAAAKPHFEASLKHNPDAGGALNGLARVLRAEGDLDGAIKVWQHMLKVSPGPNAGTFGLAEAYLEQEKYKEALPLLEQLVKLQPQDDVLRTKLALAKEKAGK